MELRLEIIFSVILIISFKFHTTNHTSNLHLCKQKQKIDNPYIFSLSGIFLVGIFMKIN